MLLLPHYMIPANSPARANENTMATWLLRLLTTARIGTASPTATFNNLTTGVSGNVVSDGICIGPHPSARRAHGCAARIVCTVRTVGTVSKAVLHCPAEFRHMPY